MYNLFRVFRYPTRNNSCSVMLLIYVNNATKIFSWYIYIYNINKRFIIPSILAKNLFSREELFPFIDHIKNSHRSVSLF